MMPKVEIYTTPICGFCRAAKRLLNTKGVEYSEIDLFKQPGRKAEMLDRAKGRHTVPQIFIGTTHVGGFDDLMDLDMDGKLDPLLAG